MEHAILQTLTHILYITGSGSADRPDTFLRTWSSPCLATSYTSISAFEWPQLASIAMAVQFDEGLPFYRPSIAHISCLHLHSD